MRVDFPAPFGPNNTNISSLNTSTLTPSKAFTVAPLYIFSRFIIRNDSLDF